MSTNGISYERVKVVLMTWKWKAELYFSENNCINEDIKEEKEETLLSNNHIVRLLDKTPTVEPL